MDSIRIKKGTILLYRVFDVAEEIDLVKVEKLLTSSPGLQERLRLTRIPGHSIVIRNAPVHVRMGQTPIIVGNREYQADTHAKIWDYGVMSVVFQIPIPEGSSWEQLLHQASVLELSNDIDTAARKRSEELSKAIEGSLQGAAEWAGFEDYTIYFFEQIEGVSTGEELLNTADIPALILAETDRNLSIVNRESILENTYQYRDNDLTVIDWNSAIVWEPSGQRDIPDVLEFAVTHLLEMRYYDDLIDRRLTLLYDSIEAQRKKRGRSPFWKLSHEASSRYIEFSEFLGRVENSLKVVGDFYLARLFRGAVRRFRVPDWQGSISRKMEILAQVSELLQGEINTQRSLILEMIIIGLIAFEVIYALVQVR
ncbi:MAG: hypothetical protein ACK5QT_09890 [Oligoflexia bacterium]|jgi:hypothetical protein